MKKIFENNYIIITIAEEVVKDFEYLEDFIEVYNDSFEEVETLEELQEVIGWEALEYDYTESLTPLYYWDIKERFDYMEDSGELEEVFEYIEDYHSGIENIINFENFNMMEFRRQIIYFSIEKILSNEIYTFLNVAQIENK